jgi:HD superfamily phosphohydrolase
MLYGKIELPDWLEPFIRLPEFVRLREVRLSNIDSIDFKDFGTATRWSHGIAVSYLANLCAKQRGLSLEQTAVLTISGLLHDVATPPFAHTAEYVLSGFDHELETHKILSAISSQDSNPDLPVFGSALPQFATECKKLSKVLGVIIDPSDIALCILGQGSLGFLINGTLDLDNADNVTRGAYLMGLPLRRELPLDLVSWLAKLKNTPTNLEKSIEKAVKEWLELRSEYYFQFFHSSDQELGRQALLQHLMRIGQIKGLPRSATVWNTDSGFLSALEDIDTEDRSEYPLKELVARFRLLEKIRSVCTIEIYEKEIMRQINTPKATAWIEKKICVSGSNMFLMITENKSKEKQGNTLFNEPVGKLLIFKLGTEIKWGYLEKWIQESIGVHKVGYKLNEAIRKTIAREIGSWCKDHPWNIEEENHNFNTKAALNAISDWGFRLSRNRSLHAYPGTYVHALPSALIHSLGLQGCTIIDPFGGTGQTATEVIKTGGYAISADSNSVSTLVAQAKFTYLSQKNRAYLRDLNIEHLMNANSAEAPDYNNREKWHHPITLKELSHIYGFINSHTKEKLKPFLKTCFSAILPSTTARRGKQHGYFADNTPLEKGTTLPPYQDAYSLFLNKVSTNVNLIEQFYGHLERNGRNPKIELDRVQVLKINVANSNPENYCLPNNRLADGIITSPPYLCMADYSLGNRLSYYWLFPDELESDYKAEIGSRRERFSPDKAKKAYFENMRKFADVSYDLLREGGYLAMVIGEPQSKAYKDTGILDDIDNILEEVGFIKLWQTWRPIQWHRNQGYQHLRQERVSVYKKYI